MTGHCLALAAIVAVLYSHKQMAKLTKKDTIRVAELAKLDLKPSEVEKFTDQLSKVIELIEELDEVDTEAVEPTAQTTGLINITREDKIDETNALPQDGFFEVPQIIVK